MYEEWVDKSPYSGQKDLFVSYFDDDNILCANYLYVVYKAIQCKSS